MGQFLTTGAGPADQQIRAGTLPGFGNEVVAYFKGPGKPNQEYPFDFGRTVMAQYISMQKMAPDTAARIGLVTLRKCFFFFFFFSFFLNHIFHL